jgi:hypothetical protein
LKDRLQSRAAAGTARSTYYRARCLNITTTTATAAADADSAHQHGPRRLGPVSCAGREDLDVGQADGDGLRHLAATSSRL